jgi:hypothetical protein
VLLYGIEDSIEATVVKDVVPDDDVEVGGTVV